MNSMSSKGAMPLPLLENYQEDTRKIEILRFELKVSSDISDDEIITAMNFTHEDGTGVMSGRVSDKTAYIALHYRQKAEAISRESTNQLASKLWDMEQERKRLHHYVSQLPPRQREVIERVYMERQPKETIAKSMDIAVRTVDKIRKSAEEELIRLYDFASKLR